MNPHHFFHKPDPKFHQQMDTKQTIPATRLNRSRIYAPLLLLIGTPILIGAAEKPNSDPGPRKPYDQFEPRLIDRQASSKFFQEMRERQVVPLDSTNTLDLLTETLSQTDEEEVQRNLLRGIVLGLKGRASVQKPKGWTAASRKLKASSKGDIRGLAQQLDQIFGDKDAAERALTSLGDRNLPPKERLTNLNTLITQGDKRVKEKLPGLLDETEMRLAAIRAFGAIHDPRAPKLLFSRYPNWDSSTRRAVIETLATRKDYASALLVELKEERLPKEHIPAHVARPLASLLGDSFTSVFGDLDEMSEDKAQLLERYRNLLTEERLAKADPSKGRLVYAAACAACHQLYGEGGELGPDLTGSNRADLDYILLNMIEPSADIPEAYQLVTLHTKNGQVIGGTVGQEDDQRIVLKMVGQTTTVLKSNIEKREVSPMSMMPEGLLPTLKDEQVLDLVKYLRTTQQVDLPK